MICECLHNKMKITTPKIIFTAKVYKRLQKKLAHLTLTALYPPRKYASNFSAPRNASKLNLSPPLTLSSAPRDPVLHYLARLLAPAYLQNYCYGIGADPEKRTRAPLSSSTSPSLTCS